MRKNLLTLFVMLLALSLCYVLIGCDDEDEITVKVPVSKTFSLTDLQALDVEEPVIFINEKKGSDHYSFYKGVKVSTLLEAAGVDLSDPNIESIEFLSADLWENDPITDLTLITDAYPEVTYYADLDDDGLGTDCGIVDYGDYNPDGLTFTDGEALPNDQYLMLAWMEDGERIEAGAAGETAEDKWDGDGPFMVVPPQSIAGEPDRGQYNDPCGDDYEFNIDADHNGSFMLKFIVGIRVNPIPDDAEYTPFDETLTTDIGLDYIDNEQIEVYGYGVTE